MRAILLLSILLQACTPARIPFNLDPNTVVTKIKITDCSKTTHPNKCKGMTEL